MANGLKDIAVVYSGDAAYILSENEDIELYPTKRRYEYLVRWYVYS